MSESAGQGKYRGYGVRRERWTLAGRSIDLTWPADMDALLDLPATHTRFARDEYMPYWAQPWPASILLAEWILAHEPANGRQAIELGCGVGLVSVAAALRGWQVTASDYDEDAMAFAVLNAERNGVRLQGSRRIDYRDDPRGEIFDCILAADLLYERRLIEPVARWIAAALAPEGVALVSDPNRSAADGFVGMAEGLGLVVETRETSTTAPAGLLTRGRIWRVQRPA